MKKILLILIIVLVGLLVVLLLSQKGRAPSVGESLNSEEIVSEFESVNFSQDLKDLAEDQEAVKNLDQVLNEVTQ